jgi:adenylate kinase
MRKSKSTLKSIITIVTGTPGTGKTTVAKRLAKKHNATYIDVNEVIKEHKLGKDYDKARNVKIIDTKKLNHYLIKIIKEAKANKESLIIDSHLSHYLPKENVDICIVTKTTLRKLQNRLKKRKYSKAKIQENMECEIFDICLMEAKEAGYRVEIVET